MGTNQNKHTNKQTPNNSTDVLQQTLQEEREGEREGRDSKRLCHPAVSQLGAHWLHATQKEDTLAGFLWRGGRGETPFLLGHEY